MERVLVIVKPDGVERSLIGKVISTFEEAGLKVVALKMLKATEDIVQKHYTDDEEWLISVGTKTKKSYAEKGTPLNKTEKEIGIEIRGRLITELTRVPVVAAVFEGNAAVDVGRKLAGTTEPRKSDPSTIRGKYSSDTYSLADGKKRPLRNILHVSESPEIAQKEIAIWFSEKEVCSYKRADEDVMYE